MKLPFPQWTLNSNAKVYYVNRNEYNELEEVEVFNGRVNHVQKTKQILNAQRELIMLSGLVVIPGDLNIDITNDKKPLYVELNNSKQRVMQVNKPNNPDGSIFSTELYF